MDPPVLLLQFDWEDSSVIVVILCIAVLALFVLSVTSSFFSNRRQGS